MPIVSVNLYDMDTDVDIDSIDDFHTEGLTYSVVSGKLYLELKLKTDSYNTDLYQQIDGIDYRLQPDKTVDIYTVFKIPYSRLDSPAKLKFKDTYFRCILRDGTWEDPPGTPVSPPSVHTSKVQWSYTPSFINLVVNEKPKYVVSHTVWNSLWNTTITQCNRLDTGVLELQAAVELLKADVLNAVQGNFVENVIDNTAFLQDKVVTGAKIADETITNTNVSKNTLTHEVVSPSFLSSLFENQLEIVHESNTYSGVLNPAEEKTITIDIDPKVFIIILLLANVTYVLFRDKPHTLLLHQDYNLSGNVNAVKLELRGQSYNYSSYTTAIYGQYIDSITAFKTTGPNTAAIEITLKNKHHNKTTSYGFTPKRITI